MKQLPGKAKMYPIIKRAMLIVITFLVTDNRLKNLYIGFI